MYAGTIFTIDDQSDIVSLPISEVVAQPIQFMGFTADKGTEDYKYVQGDDFFKCYGDNISFEKHGQPLLQAANVINNGGMLYCKRVVAPDSTLANAGIAGTLSVVDTQKVNEDGKKMYYKTGSTTEQVPEDDPDADLSNPVMIKAVQLSYNIIQLTGLGNDLAQAATAFQDHCASMANTYPLFLMTDTGRGESEKRVIIAPDYTMSRSYEYLKYSIKVLEGNNQVSSLIATLNPFILEGNTNVGFDNVIKNTGVPQLRSKFFNDQFVAFVSNITEKLTAAIKQNIMVDDPSKTEDEALAIATAQVAAMRLEYQDLFFGKSYKGVNISDALVVSTDTQLSSEYGVDLKNGSNGSFGDSPINAEKYAEEMEKVFLQEADGGFNDTIYDVNNTPMHLIVDANYPLNVKKAIVKFASFREDISFLMDICNYDSETGKNSPCKSLAELKIATSKFADTRTRYTVPYCTWYDIVDPYTRRQITVSMGYSLARLVIKHFVNGRNRPFAGLRYGLTIPEAIEGTLNFSPKIVPGVNQKTDLEEMRINYACFLQNQLVIETEYTYQERYTDLSYANNVFAIQEIIEAIRAKCPTIRYSFTNGKDFEDYKDAVQAVLDKYAGNFYSLTMEYVEDAAYVNNKIFYAVIKVKFRQFVQTEMFKITALPYVDQE